MIDAQARSAAASDLDRNVIVTAGAGTGKTRLLVDRLIHLLIGRGVPLRRIVALTFTEKAAGEMRVRLAARLEALLAAARGAAVSTPPLSLVHSPSSLPDDELQFEPLRALHRLSASQVETRAREALENLDRALIGTIHGFAAHILRLFPVEAGVDPTFEVDTGAAHGACFDREWAAWLGEELGPRAPRRKAWLAALARIDLPMIEALAQALSNFLVPVPLPPEAAARRLLAEAARTQAEAAEEAAARCADPKNNLAVQLRGYEELLRAAAREGADAAVPPAILDKEVSKAKKGWAEGDFDAARGRAEAARSLLRACGEVDDRFVGSLVSLLEPFVRRFRKRFLAGRRISFDGLLALSRDLVRDHFRAQERLKREFEAILVDEFQDTDPVQAELLLLLAQKPGRPTHDVRAVELAPGKLFVVGDPKQSIYGFRRADIAAFEWVRGIVRAQGGAEYPLVTNFRSRPGIVAAVNALFERLIVAEADIQPPFEPLAPGRAENEGATEDSTIQRFNDSTGTAPCVEIRLVAPGKAEETREAEAEWIARWIEAYVNPGGSDLSASAKASALRSPFGATSADFDLVGEGGSADPPKLPRSEGGPVATHGQSRAEARSHAWEGPSGPDSRESRADLSAEVRRTKAEARPHAARPAFRDVALLLRTLTSVHTYLEALKRRRIPYLVEGERHFFTNPEVVDVINLLQAIENPRDRMALAGMLRSPVGGLPDTAILALAEAGALDFRAEVPAGFPGRAAVRELFERMRKLHAQARRLPLDEWVEAAFDALPVMEAAAAAHHGEQRVANLHKVRRLAAEWGREPDLTPSAFIRRLAAAMEGGAEEGESPLADATVDAVRVLSIHKSKGLEFPVVILGNLHGETGGGKEDPSVSSDWATGAVGIAAGGVRNAASVVTELRARRREEAETRRVLYVAMTRAKERLVLSGAAKAASGSLLELIEEAVGAPLAGEASRVGDVSIPVTMLPVAEAAPPPRRAPEASESEADWAGIREAWERRRERAAGLAGRRRFVSPSRLEEERMDAGPAAPEPEVREAAGTSPLETRNPKLETRGRTSSRPAALGTLCHRVLEGWDFAWGAERIAAAARAACGVLREGEPREDWEDVEREAAAILRAFHGTEAYRRLAAYEILGREVPLLTPDGGRVMRGVIDLLVRDRGGLTVVDYKTDDVARGALMARAEEYRMQGEVYREAVRAAAGGGAAPGFRLVFLRTGEVVEM